MRTRVRRSRSSASRGDLNIAVTFIASRLIYNTQCYTSFGAVPEGWVRIFKNKALMRFAKKAGIGDALLCESIRDAERGLIAADLGGGVIKLVALKLASELLAYDDEALARV